MAPPPPEYYKFDVGQLPDDLYHPQVPVEKWLATTKKAGADGFPPNSLNKLSPIPWDVEVERLVGNALYMIGNILPFLVPILTLLSFFYPIAKFILVFLFYYVGLGFALEAFFFKPRFIKKYKRSSSTFTKDIKENQHSYTEHNASKYHSTTFVYPKNLHRPAMEKTPMIFCAVPHGVVPIGITAYPVWSKLFNDKLCHWTAAPIVLKLPLVGDLLKFLGYIPAKSKNILDMLTKKEENVGVILDGIAGMFQPGHQETAYLNQRKGIVKIALRAGVPLVPVYGFGHTALFTVVVDPFGIMKWLSNKMEASITPYFGRFGWFLGPPRRIPLAICLGEPVWCPQVDEPTKEQVDMYHQQLLDSYRQLFDKHKMAYGWGEKELKFV
jgi:hypothetical protein